MKIAPITIEYKTLYENRHLFSDDFQYNSLIISNLINKNVILMDVQNYHTLDDNIKKYFFDEKPRFNYILSKDGLYQRTNSIRSYTFEFFNWEFFNRSFLTGWMAQTIDILTVVNEE